MTNKKKYSFNVYNVLLQSIKIIVLPTRIINILNPFGSVDTQ